MLRPAFLVPATITAAAGFGVMNVFWALERPRATLRGLYSYLTSSVGDALCIPIMVGAINAARVSLTPAPSGPIAGAVGALCSVGVSVATQAAWLADPNPDPNWTLPSPHTFNFAGWYHAGFTVALAGYVGYLVGDAVARLKAGGVTREFQQWQIIATVAGAVFAGLLIADNLANLDRSASRASMFLLAAGALALGVMAIWTVRQRPEK